MRVIVGVDGITWPVTGIARYVWELARRLPATEDIKELRFFAHGKFVSGKELACINEDSPRNPSKLKWLFFSAMKRHLSASAVAAWVYGRALPAIESVRLERFPNYLFHSPNFLVPRHDGPSIATIHDLSAFRFPQWHPRYRVKRLNNAIKKTLETASHLITDSEAVRQEIIDYFSWPEERVTAVQLGVADNFFRLEHRELAPLLMNFGLTPGAYSLCVSTIEPRKNIDKLITAFARLPVSLQKSYPLVLVGDRGWNGSDVHRQIAEGRKDGRLRYLGYVPETSLPALYSGCRAFLYPSLYEGFGLPLLEAMACGAPVLTSNCSCMPELVGDAGILVDPADVSSISAGTERVLTDEVFRSSAVELGIKRAQTLTWDRTARETAAVYRRVWEGKH
jgi:glycosyltransferase involved in cell wall biosynthesis